MTEQDQDQGVPEPKRALRGAAAEQKRKADERRDASALEQILARLEGIETRQERIEARLGPEPRAAEWSTAREYLRHPAGPEPAMTPEQTTAMYGPEHDAGYIDAATRYGPSSPAAHEALQRAHARHRKSGHGETVQQRYDRLREEDGSNTVHSAQTLTRKPQGAPMVMSAPGDPFRAPAGAWNQAPPATRPWTQAELSAWAPVPQAAPMPLPPNAVPPSDVHPEPHPGLRSKGTADE